MIATQIKWSALIGAIIHLSLAALFGFCFYDRFWAWRSEIAQVSTGFITPDGSNVTSAGIVWAIPGSVFALLGVIRIARFTHQTLRTQDVKHGDSSNRG